MQKQVSLSTVALLSLLWEKEKTDYLDVIAQFVLRSLPPKKDEIIDVDSVTRNLRNEYGFEDIPRQVIEKILIRLSNKPVKRIQYVRRNRSSRQFFTAAVFDHAVFDHNRNETRNAISSVLQDLILFLEINHLHKRIDENTAAEYLFHFFEAYGLTVMHDNSKLKSITVSSGTQNFYVARFILDSIEKRKESEQRLIQITTGFLIYKAVYFFSSELKTSIESKLHGAEFYLDCSIVIDALGYDSSSDEKAFDEMNQLIRSNGGQVCVFEHTIEEASNLLIAYAKHPQNHNLFSFPELQKKDYPQDALFALAQPSAISGLLKKKQISIHALPSYNPKSSSKGKKLYVGFQDEKAIENQLKKYQASLRKSSNGNKGTRVTRSSSSRIDYDVKSLSAIGRIRKEKNPTNLEKCQAIIITQDWTLCNCMHDLYPKQFPPEISFAIRDIDIVSLLWLSQYNKKSKLPQHILIANAVAACEVSQDIMDQAIELATRMEKDGILQPEAALIIRSTNAIRPLLFEKTHNDPRNLTEDSIKSVISAFIERESIPDKAKAIQAAVDKTSEHLSSIHAKEMDEKNHQIEQMVNEQRDTVIKMREDAEQTARIKANRAAFAVKAALAILWVALVAVSVFCWIKGGIRNGIVAIILDVLALLQIVDYLKKFINIPKRTSQMVEDWVFARSYDKELKRREEISHISLRI